MGSPTVLAAAALVVVVIIFVGATAGSDEPCSPGQVKMEECNTCRCAAGTWECTHSGCPHLEKDDGAKVKHYAQPCVPNTTFRQDCNTCTCDSGGSFAICTLKGCRQRNRREIVCSPGTIFKKGCNLCHCLADGRSTTCMAVPCSRRNY